MLYPHGSEVGTLPPSEGGDLGASSGHSHYSGFGRTLFPLLEVGTGVLGVLKVCSSLYVSPL